MGGRMFVTDEHTDFLYSFNGIDFFLEDCKGEFGRGIR